MSSLDSTCETCERWTYRVPRPEDLYADGDLWGVCQDQRVRLPDGELVYIESRARHSCPAWVRRPRFKARSAYARLYGAEKAEAEHK